MGRIMIPTTDEMDKTTPKERHKLVGQCSHCGDWVHFTRGKDKEVCPKDGGSLIIGSILLANVRLTQPGQSARLKVSASVLYAVALQ